MNRSADPRTRGAARGSVVAVAAAVALIVLALVLYQGGAGPSGTADASPVRTLPTLPTLGPRTSPVPQTVATEPPGPTTDPLSVAACKVDQLAMAAGGWSGATGSMAGGVTLVNVSSETCRVSGRPSLELEDKSGHAIAEGVAATADQPVAIVPGGVANVIAVWSNWCGDPPARPLSVTLSVAGTKGTLRATVVDWNAIGGEEFTSLPRCDQEGAGSSIGAPVPFRAAERPAPATDDAACAANDLAAFLGIWGAAAGTSYASVVLFNQGGVGCLIDASPPLELRDANGRLLVRGERWPDAGPLDLPAGLAASTYVGFADWCLRPPKLPFAWNLRIGGELLPIALTSKRSVIGIPACQSAPASATPDLFYNGPFALPEQ